jgi:hypothetical protein
VPQSSKASVAEETPSVPGSLSCFAFTEICYERALSGEQARSFFLHLLSLILSHSYGRTSAVGSINGSAAIVAAVAEREVRLLLKVQPLAFLLLS